MRQVCIHQFKVPNNVLLERDGSYQRSSGCSPGTDQLPSDTFRKPCLASIPRPSLHLHSNNPLLHNNHHLTPAQKMPTIKLAASASRQINAVVVSAGLMQKTVKARIGVQKMNKFLGKVRSSPSCLLNCLPSPSFLSQLPSRIYSPTRAFRSKALAHFQHLHLTNPSLSANIPFPV